MRTTELVRATLGPLENSSVPGHFRCVEDVWGEATRFVDLAHSLSCDALILQEGELDPAGSLLGRAVPMFFATHASFDREYWGWRHGSSFLTRLTPESITAASEDRYHLMRDVENVLFVLGNLKVVADRVGEIARSPELAFRGLSALEGHAFCAIGWPCDEKQVAWLPATG